MTDRVLLIHQNFVWGQDAGNRRALRQLTALADAGYSVDVLCSSVTYWGERRTGDSNTVSVHEEGRVRIHQLPVLGRSGPKSRARSYLEFLRRASAYLSRLERPSWVLATTPPLPQVALSIWAALRWRAPLILEVRDLWPACLRFEGLVRSSVVLLGLEWLEATVYDFADGVLAVSPAFVPYLCGMGIDEASVSVLPTGCSTVGVEPVGGKAWREAQGLVGKTLVFYGGSFSTPYRIPELIKAAEESLDRCPEVVWVLAGAGLHRELVEAAAERLQNLRYLGPLPPSGLAEVLSAVDIGLVSLRATPFYEAVLPGKLMDVMAAGIPVLSWVDGQTGVLLNESGGGLVAAGGDVNGLLDGLEELCAAGEEGRRAMGESGRRWASAHLDGQVLAEQWAEGLAASLTGAQGGGVMRFLLSAVRGARAALGGRSSRILGPLMGPGAGGKPAVAMRRWLEQRRSIESGPARS